MCEKEGERERVDGDKDKRERDRPRSHGQLFRWKSPNNNAHVYKTAPVLIEEGIGIVSNPRLFFPFSLFLLSVPFPSLKFCVVVTSVLVGA